MGSSAILRRWSGILRCVSNANRNRMMSSGVVPPPPPPLLMLPPVMDVASGTLAYKFHSLTTKEEKAGGELHLPVDIKDAAFVGSSHGWLALYNRLTNDLFLSNPISGRHIKLPPLPDPKLGPPYRVILSGLDDEDVGVAFMTFGFFRDKLAFCSLGQGNLEWNLLSDDGRVYENLVYSNKHKRLFCITEDSYNFNIGMESWNVDAAAPTPTPTPTREWVIQGKEELDLSNGNYPYLWPGMRELKQELFQMKYLVCAEQSGELFLVVRHVNLRAGPYNALVQEILPMVYKDWSRAYIRIPYKTVDFDVYRVDLERLEVAHMEDSLQGLAIFIGTNQPLAIPAVGLKPDSIYYTDENRLVVRRRTTYGGHDNGIFDYRNKEFYPCTNFYPIEFHKIRRILPPPLWFNPSTTTTIISI